MPVIEITSPQQYDEIINQDKVNIIDFWAMWCGLCRAISPTFEKLSNEDGSPIGFYKVDVDAATDISEELGIRAMPTFVVFRNGSKVGEVVRPNAQQLEALVRSHT